MSEHLSLAMLEYFVHIEPEDTPADLAMIAADVPDGVPRELIRANRLPQNWRQMPAPPELAALGDEFVQRRRSAILIIPSALAPVESNWLINPVHPAFSQIQILRAEPFVYDLRMFRRG